MGSDLFYTLSQIDFMLDIVAMGVQMVMIWYGLLAFGIAIRKWREAFKWIIVAALLILIRRMIGIFIDFHTITRLERYALLIAMDVFYVAISISFMMFILKAKKIFEENKNGNGV